MNVGAERLRVHLIAQEAGLVPGGFGTVQQLQNQTLLQWLRERAPKTRFMTRNVDPKEATRA